MSDEESTDSYLTTYQLIQALETVVRMSQKMNLLSDYIISDIEFKKNRSELYKRLSSFLTGTIIIGAVGKLGAIAVGLLAPFIIAKIRVFILSL